jgi:myosin-5
MIEGKLGILDLLDEESRLPNGQDKSLVLKLYTRYGPDEHKFFAKPRFGEKEFVVKHYAIDVTYQIEGFIDKNKDTVSDEQLEMLNNSTFEFFKEVIHLESESDSSVGKGPIRKPKKPTLGSIFKGSLIKLMETLRQTNPHYIRCIKPNQSKVAFEFEAQNVLGQLIACGVLETIKISRAGYPSKQLYNDFVNRYYLLVSSKQWSTEPRKLTESICKETIKGEGKFELGLTKVFFRAGQLAYLEKMRSIRLTSAVIVLQKNFIRVYHQKRYKKTIAAAKLVQEAWKNYMFVREKKLHKKIYAAITIQSNFRGYSARKKYGSARSLQKAREEKLAKKKAEEDALKAKLAEAERVAELARLKREAGAAKAAEEAEKARLERLAEAQKMAEASRAAEIAAKTQPLLEKNEALETLIKTKDEQIAPLLAENERLHSLVLTKTEEMNPLIEENEKLKIRLTQKEDTLTPMVAENLGLQKTMDEKDAQLELLKKENLRLDSLVRKRDDEITGFLEREKESIESIMQFKQTLQSRPKRDDAETASLKKELNSLREQLNRLVVGKYRSDANTAQFFETDQPIARRSNPLTMQSMNRMSMQMYESASQRVSQSLGRVESVDSKPFKVRPIEIDDDSAVPQDKATRMLQDPELQDEIADNLITGLRIPEPRSRKTPSRREIFFPAHMLGCVLSEFLQHRMVDAMRETFGVVVKTISNVTAKYNDDFQSAFWLTNNFELLGVIKTARINYPKPAESNQNDESSVMANLAGIDSDIRALMVDIYDGWLKAHRQTLTTMIVPAVIENQSLSGYVCKKSGGLWSQWTTVTSSNVKCSIEQLIEHLFKISAIMKYYFFEESIQRQFLTELIRTIGVTSFNHLLTRANFSTWKRGVQIEHNVTLLENWCNSEGLSQAGVYLQQLMQASKLLTLKKSSVSDVNIIYEKCFLLNPTQIKKLLAGYTADDFDSPLSSEVFNEVIMRSRKTEHQANAVDYTPEFVFPEPRDIQNIEKYIPPTAKVPFLQAVTLFSSEK